MEPVKVVVHLHRQKKNLDVNGCQIQIPNSSKKCNPSAVIQDDFGNVDTAFQRLKETTTIFDKFLQGETSSLITLGANSTHIDNYKRTKLFILALEHLQSITKLNEPDFKTKLSIAFVGLSDGRAVDLNNERTLDFDFLGEGISEPLYELSTSLSSVIEKLKTGFSLPGLFISVRLEKVSMRTSMLIDRSIESSTDVFHALGKKYNHETRSQVSVFNFFDFGAVRFGSEHASPTLSQTALYFSQFVRYGDSKHFTHYKMLLRDVLKGCCHVLVDIEVREPNKEVETVLEFCEQLRHYKVPIGLNCLDARVAVLYQLEEKFKTISQQVNVKTLENNSVMDLCHKMKEKIENQRTKICDLDLQLRKEIDEKEAVAKDLSEAKDSIVELTQKLEDLSTEVEIEREKFCEEMKSKNEELKKTQTSLDQMQKKVDGKTKSETASLKQLEKLKLENEKLVESLKKAEEELQAMKDAEQEICGEIEEMKKELDKIPESKKIEKELQKVKKSEGKLSKENDELVSTVQELKNKIKELERESSARHSREAELSALVQEKESQLLMERKNAAQSKRKESRKRSEDRESVDEQSVVKQRRVEKVESTHTAQPIVDDIESGPEAEDAAVSDEELPTMKDLSKKKAAAKKKVKRTELDHDNDEPTYNISKENLVYRANNDVASPPPAAAEKKKLSKGKMPEMTDVEPPKRPEKITNLLTSSFGTSMINPKAMKSLKTGMKIFGKKN